MERDLLNNKTTKIHRVLGVAYITRVQMVLFIQSLANTLTIPLPPEIVKDLDILDQAKFSTYLAGFITSQKLPPASLTILLANDLLFAKQMLNNDPEAQRLEEQAFVDMVPYEEVGTQKIPFNNAVYITVANKDFYEGVIKAFEANNFTISMVLPAYMFSKELNFAAPLAPQALSLLLPKFNNLRQFNFLQVKPVTIVPEGVEKAPAHEVPVLNDTSSKEPPKKSNRTLVLVGVFIMLIGILISVYLWTSQSNQDLRDKKSKAQAANTQPVAPTVEPATPTQPTVKGVEDLKITLIYPESESQNAIIVGDSLNKSGFHQVEKEESNDSSSTNINFNNSIPQDIKNKVIAAVSRVYKQVIIQNSNTYTTPITIKLGAKTN